MKENKYGYDTDCYFSSCTRWYIAYLASLSEMGILSQRWRWIGSSDFGYPAVNGTDLKEWNKGIRINGDGSILFYFPPPCVKKLEPFPD